MMVSNKGHNLQNRIEQFTDQKKTKKLLRIETDISYNLKTENVQYQHWP